MTTLSASELRHAIQIARAGLEKAAESLSFFMKETIRVDDSDFRLDAAAALDDFPLRTEKNSYLLITDVIGELPGICCLVFTEEEADQLRTAALPPSVLSNPQLMAEMGDAILLEVDNIIAASVVTQFSNQLNCRMHGGVPRMKKLNSGELTNFVRSSLYKESFAINIKTKFQSEHLNFHPEFLWLFDQAFIDRIRAFQPTVAE